MRMVYRHVQLLLPLLMLTLTGCGGCNGLGQDHPVFSAATEGNVEKVREALDQDPTLISETYLSPPGGRNPIPTPTNMQLVHFAAQSGHVEVLKLLKEKGADLHATTTLDGEHPSPIHLAAKGGHTKAVEWLIDNGVSVDAKSGLFDYTPLHFAIKGLYFAQDGLQVETVGLLLERGAATELRANAYEAHCTPLLYLCYFFKRTDKPEEVVAIAKLLLEKGADVNARMKHEEYQTEGKEKGQFVPADLDGKLPIELISTDHQALAELLIAHGASREVWEKRVPDVPAAVEQKE